MKFRFRLGKVMDHRQVLVDLAQKDFQSALARELEEERKLKDMTQDLLDAYEMQFQVTKRGGVVSESLANFQTFIEGQKIRIDRVKRVIVGLHKITEEKRLVLVEALKNLKTLEKLKERKLAEFKKEKQKRELKELDQLVVMGFGRRSEGIK